MNDKELIDLYNARNEDAIKLTAEKYGARLRMISYSVTSDAQSAEECENDTYLYAWNDIPPNDPGSYFFSYLACIVRHLSIDCCRKRSALNRSAYIVELSEELQDCLPSSFDLEKSLETKALGEAISRFLRSQSEEKRVIFVRRYFYMDSISAIAARLSIGESKVKTTLLRQRKNLREYLLKEGYTI